MSSAPQKTVEDRDKAIREVLEQLKRHRIGAAKARARLKELKRAD